MTPAERAAAIDSFARDVLACVGIPADAQSVATYSAYVRCADDARCFVAGGLPTPGPNRSSWTCAPPKPDDPPRTVPSFDGSGPKPLDPARLALDLAAANLLPAPFGFDRTRHTWSSPHNAV